MLDYLVSLHRKEVSYQSFSPLKKSFASFCSYIFPCSYFGEFPPTVYRLFNNDFKQAIHLTRLHFTPKKPSLKKWSTFEKKQPLSHNSWCCCYFDRHFVVHGRIFEPFVKRLVSAKDPAEYTHHPISARKVLF